MTALILPAQQMPVVDANGRCTVPWYQFFNSLAAGQGSIGGLLVNPGTGNNTRTLNQVLADLANVNDYLNVGDTNYDGAIGRTLAARGRAWFPNKPWLGGTTYPTATTIVLLNGQGLHGDGKNLSTIACQTPGTPVVTLGQQIFGFELSDIAINHGGTATAGGDGLFQAQGLLDWVNDGVIRSVEFDKNYVGMNLGKAFFCRVTDVGVSNNISRGVSMTSTGVSTVPSGAAGGPLQWYFTGCSAGSNGGDGFAYTSTAAAVTTISVGTLTACTTFANNGHGVAAYGNANAGIYSVRISGGFYGNDSLHEIYLDSYGNHHLICPDFIELAGQNPGGSATACGVYTTANGNDMSLVRVGHINGCNAEGVLAQSTRLQVLGGFITNNGLSATASRQNGVSFFGVAGKVTGATITDTGSGAQLIGVAGNTDGVQIVGCGLSGNVSAPIALTGFGVGATNQVSGCLPLNINQLYTDTLHVYGAAAFVGAGGITSTLGITVLAGGMTFTTAVVGNGLTVDNATFRISAGVQTAASGVTGQLDAPTVKVSTQLTTTGSAITVLQAGAISMSGGITIVSGGMNFTNTGTNGINAADDISIRRSLGVGTGAAGVTGRVDLAATGGIIVGAPTGGFIANSINLTGNYDVNGVAAAGFSGAYTGNVTFTGNLTVTGQTQTQDLYVTRSIGFTALPDGVGGHFAGSPIAFTGASINVTNALAVSGAASFSGGVTISVSDLAMSGRSINNANTITAGGLITANGGIQSNAASSFSAGVTISASGMTFTAGVVGNGLTVDNIQIRKSLGVGTAGTLDGIDGHVAIGVALIVGAPTGSYLGAGTVNLATSISLNNFAYTNP